LQCHSRRFWSVRARPHLIDYLSLDVEGAETYIMKNFPLSSYRINTMTVERPDEELKEHLEANGFKLMGHISKFGKSLWIHNEFVEIAKESTRRSQRTTHPASL
jgi:hypothetical protein